MAIVALTFTSCGESADERFVNKWELTAVDGMEVETDMYMDLRDDGTYDARWNDEDLNGTWTVLDFEDGGDIDLFLFIGEEDSRIFTVTSIGDGEMVCDLEGMAHVFN